MLYLLLIDVDVDIDEGGDDDDDRDNDNDNGDGGDDDDGGNVYQKNAEDGATRCTRVKTYHCSHWIFHHLGNRFETETKN